jgi:hypothetical protein
MISLTTPLQQRLARLVVKDEVSLGGLGQADRLLALALVWASLPAGVATSEPGINQHLKAALAGAAAWLDTDHVELRRWLVDAGWLWRDGYGREYRRIEPAQLALALREAAASLSAIDVEPWVATQRAAHQGAREARRRQWLAAQGPAA